MKISCSSCNQRLEIPEELAGQTIECPACNASLAVPAIAAPTSVPAQVQESAPQAASSKKSKSSVLKWATFQYEALTKNYKDEKGELPAASQAEAFARLQEMGLMPTKVEQAKAAGRLADKAKREHYELLRREKERNRLKPKKFLIISVATIVGVEVIMAGKLAENPNIPPIIGHLFIILIGISTGLTVFLPRRHYSYSTPFKPRSYVVRDATGKPIETIDLPY